MMGDFMDNIEKLAGLADAYSCGGASIEVRRSEPLCRHTTFRIGGAAELFLIPNNETALIAAIGFAKDAGVRHMVIGNGSNLLFDDEGYHGAVISTSGLCDIRIEENTITAGAGAQLINVCKAARDAGLSGLEFAYGIPGSVGGAVYMNAGAYGGEMSGVVESSTYLEQSELTVHTLSASEHNYGYRDSSYKHSDRIILSASFSLKPGDSQEIGRSMTDYMSRRIDKQPLEYPSAGSVFKRCPGHYTGQMIEESGLKGYSVGGAQISEKHAGFIVNRGNATAADVLSLVEFIQKTIKERYGCELECEVIYVKP